LDTLQSSWGRDFESHFEDEMKRKDSASRGWLLRLPKLASICWKREGSRRGHTEPEAIQVPEVLTIALQLSVSCVPARETGIDHLEGNDGSSLTKVKMRL
jgi:hypothetical protein